jgi:two-component system, chemotaxis family, CheB/CheR fusion protein
VIGPLIKQETLDQPVRVWVPACSTGEEAYTIAMLLAEHAETTEKGLQAKIFATDLADNNLAAARRGVFPASMVESLSPERLDRFFEKTGESYRIKREIRETVVFAPQNLLTDPPYSKMDLVSCRNLLIYLDVEGQNRVLSLAHFALRDGGYLFLGNAESIGQLAAVLAKTVARER